MGVPKFFRYISERYPCLSEIVKEYQIPQFDNLYLDMNGIIHTCSHPEDDDPHFRITEEKIFQDIFHYIEILFRMIKPRKLFFMAVDGVAPRAKMNQQRARRFRSAKDAERLEEKAREKGETLPSEARFDSNCITPGTVFMAKLHEQLKYFVVNKISTDRLWKNCKVILSGQQTPGEGEHKIMDYIRYMRAQPGYDPNTRHCLYGLDADLIMLGLCTHEPHFSLLREEVKFGRKSTKRKSSPEEITFYLLHLSLMREYLELEFKDLENDKRMTFPFDIEKIIDDWVLMGFLVGNDFIPNLPYLHIVNGSLPILYQTYIKVLPTFDGYINEGGKLNLSRFEKFMESLAAIDLDNFQEQYADIKYFEMKTGRRPNGKQRKSYKLGEWKQDNDDSEDLIQFEPLEPPKTKNAELAALIQATNDELFLTEPNKDDILNSDDNEDENSGYEDCDDSDSDKLFQEEFRLHKRDYYTNKLDYKNVTSEVLRSQAEGYVRAIQWNLNYYYNGVCSWSWFYPHHYAPYISDIKGFADLKIEFDLGTPFLPYEQLLAVLPTASRNLLPEPYHHLMTDENSPIKSYYPEEFETDLNGKKAEWEAVVLIPFIDEEKLLSAMEECNMKLTPEEKDRNCHGPMLIYQYTSIPQEIYSAPEYFPTVMPNFTMCDQLSIDDIRIPREKLIKGAYPGVKLDVYFPGFPTTKHLKYRHRLENGRVKVHEHPSRSDNMILTVEKLTKTPALDVVAREFLGKTVYVGWPHLTEGLVVTVSNKEFRYISIGEPGQYNVVENKGNAEQNWHLEKSGIDEFYTTRFGIEVGEINILIHAKVLSGRRYMFSRQGRVTLEKQWAPVTTAYPLQVIVRDIAVHDENHTTFRDLESVFPRGSNCFMLGQPYYGCMGEVKESKEDVQNGRIKVAMQCPPEPNFDSIRDFEKSIRVKYLNSHDAATRLSMSRHLFTRVTGSILVTTLPKMHANEDTNKVNVGLNLKFSKRNEEIPGYTKREGNLWLYSEKAIELVKAYCDFCPKLFEYLNSHYENVCHLEDIFPGSTGKQQLKELSEWIKSRPYYTVERRSCGTLMLEPDVIKMVEEIVSNSKSTGKVKEIIMKVKPHLLYKPDLYIGNVPPDPNSKFQLYDRVVNVRESYTVPLGLRGTVIAIHFSEGDKDDNYYDVVFDDVFPGGLSLNCSAQKGYRLPKTALINKSYGQREYELKAGKSGELMQQMRARQTMDTSQRQFVPPHSAFVPCPTGKAGPPLYLPYMYQNSYNNMYMRPPPHASNVQPPIVPHQTRNFMPSFADNEKPKGSTVQILQQVPKSKPHPPPQNTPTRSVEKRSDRREFKVDTDFLKKVLKISPDQIKNADNTPATQQVKVEDVSTQAKTNPLSPIQPKQPESNTSNSVKLLSYYQLNGLGCPHYNYFDLPDKSVQALLMNPMNGQVVCGKPSATKLEACENVAGEVLKVIENIEPPGLMPFIPQPPKDWCQNKNSSQDRKVTTPNLKPHGSSLTTPPFVPLQAVRNHANKNVNMKPGFIKQHNTTPSLIDKTYKSNHGPKPIADCGLTAQKPFRKRTMRIAANFSTKFNDK
ncbi:putative 5'-3' exoribonuclease [Trypoxylus dichotomus]